MIAFQLLVAILFFSMGATGIGKRLINAIPVSLKAGIILGAGFSAALNVMNVRLKAAPGTIILSTLIAYFFLFSGTFAKAAEGNKYIRILRNQGIVPAQLFAIIAGPYIFKELPAPSDSCGR